MANAGLDAVQREFAELTGLFEDAALIASGGQSVRSYSGGRQELKRILRTMDRIRKRLVILQGRLRCNG